MPQGNDPASTEAVTNSATATILKHGLDADEAMKAFIGYETRNLVLDEATNKRLLRKIDLNIMPASLQISTLP